jgi:hypothetical protein
MWYVWEARHPGQSVCCNNFGPSQRKISDLCSLRQYISHTPSSLSTASMVQEHASSHTLTWRRVLTTSMGVEQAPATAPDTVPASKCRNHFCCIILTNDRRVFQKINRIFYKVEKRNECAQVSNIRLVIPFSSFFRRRYIFLEKFSSNRHTKKQVQQSKIIYSPICSVRKVCCEHIHKWQNYMN